MMKRVIPIIIFCLSAIQMALAQVTYSPELLQKAKDGPQRTYPTREFCASGAA